MLKVFTVIVLVCVISPAPSPTPRKTSRDKQQIGSREAQDATANHQDSKTSPTTAELSETPERTTIAPNTSAKESEKTTSDKWITWFTGVLAVVAVLQFFAMIVQSHYMRKGVALTKAAADAAQESASAASTNARALINAERAFLHLTVELISTSGYFGFMATNVGRTPAEILSYQLSSEFLEPGDEMLIEYNPGSLTHPQILLPNKQFGIGDWKVDRDIPSETWDETKAGKKLIIVYGRIVYRDMVGGEKHSSTFCYRCFNTPGSGPGLIQCGPEGANSYT